MIRRVALSTEHAALAIDGDGRVIECQKSPLRSTHVSLFLVAIHRAFPSKLTISSFSRLENNLNPLQ
jgi:hypothetical protein